MTSLPWSPARAAGSELLPNLQTILFSTNKPKISLTFPVRFEREILVFKFQLRMFFTELSYL